MFHDFVPCDGESIAMRPSFCCIQICSKKLLYLLSVRAFTSGSFSRVITAPWFCHCIQIQNLYRH